MRLACAALIVVASVLAGARPAAGSTLHALPATVRVNVAGLGVSYAVIASTGTVSAIAPDGTAYVVDAKEGTLRRIAGF